MNRFRKTPILQQCRRLVSTDKSTVDAREVEKFQKLGSQWWDSSSEMKILHNMNRLRVPFVRDGLINMRVTKAEKINTDKPLEGLKILDVGCGGGFLCEPLTRLGASVTGIDATEELIKIADAHKSFDKSLESLNYSWTTVEEFSIQNKESFDAIVSSEVVEHVDQKKIFLQSCVDCLKPGGSFFLTTMSKTLVANIVGICIAENILNFLPKGTHDHNKFICPHNLQRLLEECDCTTRRIHGMTLNPVTRQWIWIDSTDINYALHAIKNSKTN